MCWMKQVLSKRLLPQNKRKKKIGVTEIESVVAKIAQIPPKHVSSSDKDSLFNLNKILSMLFLAKIRLLKFYPLQ